MNQDGVIEIRGDGGRRSLDPLVPHIEHDYGPADWPTARLTEASPQCREPLAPGASVLGAQRAVYGCNGDRSWPARR